MATEIKGRTVVQTPEAGAITPDPAEGCVEAPKYSCALGGALSAINNVYRVIPIVHSGAGCGQNQNFRSYSAGSQGIGYVGGTVTPATCISEHEVVFGGEGRLREQIEATMEIMDGDLFVVVTGCIPNMIGDDVDAVVGEFRKQGKPIISIGSPGFSGNTFHGYELFFDAVITQYLTKTDTPKIKGLVNLLGVVPYQDLFWRGDLQAIRRDLEKLGLSVNVIFGDLGGVNNLKKIPAAELNIVLSPWVGIKAAKSLEDKFGTPYIVTPMPSGLLDTSDFLRKVAKALKLPKKRVDAVIDEQDRESFFELDLAADMTSSFSAALPFALVANSGQAIKLTRFLANEGGFLPVVVIVNDNPPEEYRDRIIKDLSTLESGYKPEVIFEVDTYRIRQLLSKRVFRLLLASSQERYYAADNRLLHLSVSYPAGNRLIANRTYAGYLGGLTLLEDVISLIIAPF